MHSTQQRRIAGLLLCLALISGCGYFERFAPPVPKSPKQGLVLAYSTLAGTTRAVAAITPAIGPDRAEQMLTGIDEVRAHLGQAENFVATNDITSADNALTNALEILNRIRTEITARGGKL